jgi:hypothetical protein
LYADWYRKSQVCHFFSQSQVCHFFPQSQVCHFFPQSSTSVFNLLRALFIPCNVLQYVADTDWYLYFRGTCSVHHHGSTSFLPLRWACQFPLQIWSQCNNIQCPIPEHCILDTTVRPSDLTFWQYCNIICLIGVTFITPFLFV